MIKIYIPHSNSFDYKNELYEPIRKSPFNQKYDITFPHESSDGLFDSKQIMKNCKLIVAEVSYPSTGLGIELGWANLYNIPVICIHKTGIQFSKSLNAVSDIFIEYSDIPNLLQKLESLISDLKL